MSIRLSQSLSQHGFPYVQELRQQQIEMEHTSSGEYKTLKRNLTALSVTLHENKNTYLSMLDSTLSLAERIIAVSDNRHRYRINIYLKKIKESL